MPNRFSPHRFLHPFLLAGSMLCAAATGSLVRAENVVVTLADASATEHINHYLAEAWARRDIKPAERCSDREFVRRVYLDLAGRVPTVAEVDTFLADGRDDKRTHLVDLLLGSEDHVQHFADLMDALLMGRVDEGKYANRVKHRWRAYLEDSIRQNRPWNEVAVEILLARPEDPSRRGAVWFLYERDNQHQAIAEAVAPAFFGLRIECAQCHDHMIADEIRQQDYWGLVAFFNRGKNQNSKHGPSVAESAIGGFSEFADLTGDSQPNVLTFLGSEVISESRPAGDEKQEDSDELYVSAGVEGDPRVPKFSRRQALVEQVVEGNPRLARAMVNRLWALLMARGIVHPFDQMDSLHEPSHPELLGWLVDDFVASGYDVRRLVRSISLSDAYHLSSLRPDGVEDPASLAWYLQRPLTAEQMARSIQLVVRGEFANDAALVGVFRQQFLEVLPDETVVTIRDALFLSNSPALDEYLSSSGDAKNLRPRVIALASPAERAALLFKTVFARLPDEDESAAVAKYLEERNDSLPAAIDQVIWSMLTSAEFRFNH